MTKVCFYFQVHQPNRIRKYNVFQVGKDLEYFDDEKNREIFNKVATKCYFPTNQKWLELLKREPKLKIAYSLSGVFIEQMEEYCPELLDSFKALADTGRVEFLCETSHHSLSALYSENEFKYQVKAQKKKIKELFGQTPTIFRNTELIYNNHIAQMVEDLGFKGILAEGWEPVLGWRSPNFLYRAKTKDQMPLLLKNYKLSDDVAFRFSNKGWKEFPLTAEKFAQWVNSTHGSGDIINIFMDYETFGEHQWEDTGIFNFLDHLPAELLKHPDTNFVTPSEAIKELESKDVIDIHHPLSWADLERDTSAWTGNKMQQGALDKIYKLEKDIKELNDHKILEKWRKLQTSDHFYYMCTKWFSDGDVHKYFNAFDSPYTAFMSFMCILESLEIEIKEKKEEKNVKSK